MATLTDLIKSVKDLTEATTASTQEINDAVTAAEKDQKERNKDYDDFKAILVKGGLSEEEAKERLEGYGLTKITNMNAWKRSKADEFEKSISAEKNKNFYGTVSRAVELAKIAAQIEEATTPKDPTTQLIQQQTALLNQMFIQQGGYQAPAPTPAPTTGPTWSANLLEKSRLTQEKEQKISEIRAIKKAGGITALEMAQAIADVNSDYKKKINNI